jgi:radical SAM protein with 4Fe4S-binding SPASM domain
MTAISTQVERSLAQTVATTGRWKSVPGRAAITGGALDLLDFLARGVFHVWRNHRYLTLAKLANMALVNIQFKFKTEFVLGRPYSMKIEPTNICNTKCRLCPTGIGLEGRPKGKMDLAKLKKLIDSLKWHLRDLDLSMWGDPLIVPDIYKMIRHAHDRGIWTYISSNLHALKIKPKPGQKSQAEQLVESGLDTLTCSLHGASQATYEAYQPGKNFEESVAKVRHIIETRDRMGSRTPTIQLNFVVTQYNEHERDAFQKLADELGCKTVFSTASMNARFQDQDQKLQPLGLADDLLKKKVKAHLNDWLPEDPEFVLEPYKKMRETGEIVDGDYNGKKVYDCPWPWHQSVINWDGQVVACCGSFDPGEDLGNVFELGFTKIWNSQRYRMARRSFKKRLTDEQAEGNACANCPGFML